MTDSTPEPGLTLREMVVQTHETVTALDVKFDTHIREHEYDRGRRAGMMSVFLAMRTFTSTVLPIPAAVLALMALAAASAKG